MDNLTKKAIEVLIEHYPDWKGDMRYISCWLEPGEDIESDLICEKPSVVRLKSWRGTYDRDVNL